jgi:hypothetical protein
VAKVLAIVYQAGSVRFWSKAAQHRLHADWRDRSFLELFGEWPSCWLIPRGQVKQALATMRITFFYSGSAKPPAVKGVGQN